MNILKGIKEWKNQRALRVAEEIKQNKDRNKFWRIRYICASCSKILPGDSSEICIRCGCTRAKKVKQLCTYVSLLQHPIGFEIIEEHEL